jgi:nucleotide-binding universal stress UspA family protein
MRLEATRILVPVNGDPATERTFRWTCRMARQEKSEIHAIYVMEVPLDLPLESELSSAITKGERILETIEAIGAEERFRNVEAKLLRARNAGPALVQETEDRRIDLIVLGVPYRKRFGTFRVGSTASYIFNNASCRVLFLRDRAGMPYLD